MAAVSGREDSPVPAHDPMRQFSELAGDVRDPYPMLADLRETTPVLQVSLEEQTGQLLNDAKAPKLPPLFTVFGHEYVQRVLTDNLRFSSTVYESSMGKVMGRTILQMDSPEHQRYRALVAKAAHLVRGRTPHVPGHAPGPPGDARAPERRARPPARAAP
jgi:cytochrome P450